MKTFLRKNIKQVNLKIGLKKKTVCKKRPEILLNQGLTIRRKTPRKNQLLIFNFTQEPLFSSSGTSFSPAEKSWKKQE